jgi:LDH2 family malate/lactate/ureidoglycolate dehydrogenase
MKTELIIASNELKEFVSELFKKVGLVENDAVILAGNYVDNNLIGIDSHGVRLVPNCIRRLQEGGVNPRPQIRLEAETVSTARLDGDNGLGQLLALVGMKLAMGKAKDTGIGLVVCTNTNNAGAMGSYTRIALEEGMAGLAIATTVPSMFAWGGLKRVISNPPLSVSFPGRKTQFVIDFCLGSVAWNKIHVQRDKGELIPDGWAVDRQGKLTTDPLIATDGGSVIPIGGHKGYGLSLAIELFTAILGGKQFGKDIKGLFEDPSQGEGITITGGALDVAKLIEPALLYDRAEELFQFIKRSPLKAGFAEVIIPGEPEERIKKKRREQGIPLPLEVTQALKECAAALQVPTPFS